MQCRIMNRLVSEAQMRLQLGCSKGCVEFRILRDVQCSISDGSHSTLIFKRAQVGRLEKPEFPCRRFGGHASTRNQSYDWQKHMSPDLQSECSTLPSKASTCSLGHCPQDSRKDDAFDGANHVSLCPLIWASCQCLAHRRKCPVLWLIHARLIHKQRVFHLGN